MGTGSFGGGGGGGSARSGGGGGGTGGGGRSTGVSFSTVALGQEDIDLVIAQGEVDRVLKQLPKEYVAMQFENPFLDYVYNEIFYLKTDIIQNKSWDNLEKRLEVSSGQGCLPAWIERIMEEGERLSLYQKTKVIDTVKSTLEDFLIDSLGNQPELFFDGDSKDVIKKLKNSTKYYESISANFLSGLIWRIVEREREALPSKVELRLQDACRQKANSIVSAFEKEFRHKKVGEIDMITHQNFFYTLAQQTGWITKNF